MTEGLEQRARGQARRSTTTLVIKHEQLLFLLQKTIGKLYLQGVSVYSETLVLEFFSTIQIENVANLDIICNCWLCKHSPLTS